jgi:cobaltochelatase CobS
MIRESNKGMMIETVSAWKQSGETSADFAESNGINASTLRGWKRKLVLAGICEDFAEPETPKAPKAPKVETPKVVAVTPAVTFEIEHARLASVLARVNAGIANVFVTGPAGSGKTTLAEQLATKLGRAFGMISLSGGTTESHLLGRMVPQADGSWAYVDAPFIRAYQEGGVFLLDEVDAADANVMVAVNAALANGCFTSPVNGRTYKRHANTVIVAAANTFGTGADAQYVGRNALDAATLDRFAGAVIEVDYDRRVETAIANKIAGEQGPALLDMLWSMRDKARAARLRRIVSTRIVINGSKLLAAGLSLAEIKDATTVGWTADEIRKVS